MKNKNWLRSLLCVALMLCTAFSLCACRGSVPPDEPDDPGTDPGTTPGDDTPVNPDPFTEENPWDDSLSMPAVTLLPLVDLGTKIFSGLEWTGQVGSQDANGNTVNQSNIVSIGEVAPHTATTIVYKDLMEAYQASINYAPEMSTYRKLLTGEDNTWQLAVYRNEASAKAAGVFDFYKTDYDMSRAPKYEGSGLVSSYEDAYYGGFKDVTLPASWATQGFDFPIYSGASHPWNYADYGNGAITVPLAPTVTNPVGFYRTYVDFDQEWISSGRRIYLSFGGVESAYYLYVNGYEVGYSESSFDSSDFDITPYLNADGQDNLIAVRVYRWSDGSFFENQDFLRLAGIFRDVYAYSLPGVHIADYTVITDLDSTFTDAELKISAEIFNSTIDGVEDDFFSLDVRLIDAKGNSVLSDLPLRQSVPAIASGKTVTVSMSRTVFAPHLWSDEDPYLYTLLISLYDQNGVYYGTVSQQLGFREITYTQTASPNYANVSYSTILLNGKPLVFKGVNRHDSNPEAGRYVTKELMEKDVQIMKELNINAVRTSHYPNDRYFYDMCDKYGLLVMGETNLETHYTVNTDQTDAYFKKLIEDRTISHYETAKNRTCIVMWSIGNEITVGSSIYPEMISRLKSMDPTRPIHFESLRDSGGVDVSSNMYPSVAYIKTRAAVSNNMPYVLCEYVHAMGNSVGNLAEYWEVIRANDNLIGGFIWDFVDQGLWAPIPTEDGYDYYGTDEYMGYGGSWGKASDYGGNFLQNGIIYADRTLQPEAAEVGYIYQSIWFTATALTASSRTVSIYNEYNFTNLSAFAYDYELLCNGRVVDAGSFTLDVAPGETASVEIPYQMPAAILADGEYRLNLYARLAGDTAYAPKGYVVAHEQLEIFAEVNHVSPNALAMGLLDYEQNDGTVTVSGENFTVTFDKKSGSLTSYVYGGELIMTEGPIPSFTRAKNDNDIRVGRNFAWDSIRPNGAEAVTVVRDRSRRFVTVATTIKLTQNAGTVDITYTIYGDGQITVESKLNPADYMGEMLKYGATLVIPGDYENILFYGNGPADTYVDRMQGSPLGLWSTTVTDSLSMYPFPQDCGNKTGVRFFSLTSESRSTGLIFVSATEMEASALHVSTADLSEAKYTYELVPSTENTYLNLDYGSRGTGGISCGPDTLSKYRLYNDGREYAYTYTIVPFDKENDDIDTILRTWRDADSMTQADIDQYVAGVVENAIASLTTDSSKVASVRAAYDALTETQKTLITNFDVLQKIEEGSSMKMVLLDQSANSNTGTFLNGLVLRDETSPCGYAVDGYFTSSDTNRMVNYALSGDRDFTIGLYIRMKDFDSDNVLIAKGDTQVSIKTNSYGQLEFFVFRGNWDAIILVDPGSVGLRIDQWCYVVGVREGNMLRLYINGKLVGTANNASGNVTSNASALGVGVDTSASRYGRNLYAYVHVLPFAATAEQIETQYESFVYGTTPAFTATDAVLWYTASKYKYQ